MLLYMMQQQLRLLLTPFALLLALTVCIEYSNGAFRQQVTRTRLKYANMVSLHPALPIITSKTTSFHGTISSNKVITTTGGADGIGSKDITPPPVAAAVAAIPFLSKGGAAAETNSRTKLILDIIYTCVDDVRVKID